MIRKLTSESRKEMNGTLPADDWLIEHCPTVVEYLTSGKYPDGSIRDTSTLTFFVDEGMLKAALNDRDSQHTLYATAPTLQEALLSLEKRVNDANADWRPWKRKSKR